MALFTKKKKQQLLAYLIICFSKLCIVIIVARLDFLILKICWFLQEGLDDDSFENYKGGLMAYLLRKDQSLAQESYRLWRESLAKSYTFDYSTKAAEELTSIQKEDVIDFYKTYLQESPKRRRLAVRAWGCNTNFKEAEEACMTRVSGSL